MKRETARRIGWALAGVAVAGQAAALVLRVMAGEPATSIVEESVSGSIFVLFAVVGAVITAHQPRNAVGWLFGAAGVQEATTAFASTYAAYAGTAGSAATARTWLWVGEVTGGFGPGFGVLLFVLFPAGVLLSPRWRVVVWAAVAWIAAETAVSALRPGPLADALDTSERLRSLELTNPLGVPALETQLRALDQLSLALLPLLLFAGGAALVVRFRRAHGLERQQLKWLMFSAALLTGAFIVAGITFGVLGLPDNDPLANAFISAVFLPALASIPVAAGIAVLRYRLYDIDRIISRTVSYAIVTAVIALPYVLVVPFVTRVVGGSSIAVAAGTLGAAAAFNPVRRRVQAVVDRRFNRARYDAQRTIETFSARLRDEVDLDTLRDELLNVVRHTMAPTTVSLWLRDSAATAPG